MATSARGRVIQRTEAELGNARVFGFGIGASVNRYLLDEVSHAGRGVADYVLSGETPEHAVERFYARIGLPYLTDVSVDWGGLPVDRVTPSPLPDLSALEPMIVLGRYHHAAEGDVRVTGTVGGRAFERRVHVRLPEVAPDASGIARVCGRGRKVADLLPSAFTATRWTKTRITEDVASSPSRTPSRVAVHVARRRRPDASGSERRSVAACRSACRSTARRRLERRGWGGCGRHAAEVLLQMPRVSLHRRASRRSFRRSTARVRSLAKTRKSSSRRGSRSRL